MHFIAIRVIQLSLQGVVNACLKFINIATGFAGSLHYSRVLQLSSLHNRAENSVILRVPVRHINGTNIRPLLIADGVYPLKPWLMKPYPHIGPLSDSQRRLNRELSKQRATVERALRMLKTRFRCPRGELPEDI